MQQPEAYIGGAAQLFDANGNIINETTCVFLVQFMGAFAAWVVKNTSAGFEMDQKKVMGL
jgi:chromate reductase